MKTYGIRKYLRVKGLWAVAIVVAVLLTSCIKDAAADTSLPAPHTGGMVTLTLDANAGDFSTPATRATDGDLITTGTDRLPMVFVFECAAGSSDYTTAALTQVVRTVYTNSKLQVTLNPTTADRKVRVFIVANPPANYNGTTGTGTVFNEANLLGDFGDKPFSSGTGNVVGALYTDFLSPGSGNKILTADPFRGQYIAMCGTCDFTGGITASTSSITTTLTRNVAKVTARTGLATGVFNLEGMTVINANQRGLLYNTDNTRIPSNNTVSYKGSVAATAASSIAAATAPSPAVTGVTKYTDNNPVYVYESKSGQMSAIIQGKYNGSSTSSFYKIAFNKPDGTALTVERNKLYQITVEKVGNAGYASFDEAVAGAYSNVLTDVHVIELSNHDVVDNGEYYLGVSNSEFWYYSDATTQEVVLATVSTNAPSGKLTATVTGGSGVAISTDLSWSSGITLSGEAAYELKATLGAGLTTSAGAVVMVTAGNLSRNITITRKDAKLTVAGGAFALEGTYLQAKVESDTDGWFSLSTDGTTDAGQEAVGTTTANSIYIMAEHNIAESGATPREGSAYLYRHNSSGRIKASLPQPAFNYDETFSTFPATPYIGTFHRWNETGERLIRMPAPNSTERLLSTAKGKWTAIVGEENDGRNWIVLDTKQSGAGQDDYWNATSWSTPLEAQTYEANAAYQPKNGGTYIIAGNTDNGTIYFRVGLKSTLSSASSAPRYGVIYLLYKDNTVHQKIYVRQGEAEDYLMRPGDNNGNGTITTEWGGTAAEPRPKAAKFQVFNLTAAAYKTGSTDEAIPIGPRNATATYYPTQAGAFFQWAHTDGVIAYHPSNPILPPSGYGGSNTVTTVWDEIWEDYEACPAGYHRPTDGVTNIPVPSTGPLNSEMGQSIYLNPPADNVSNTNNLVWGYYADGFFDRRGVAKQGASSEGIANSSVAISTPSVAYIGSLFYNPNNHASLFFPAAGMRFSAGELYYPGEYGYYWSASAGSSGYDISSWSMRFASTSARRLTITRYSAFPVRCVKGEY